MGSRSRTGNKKNKLERKMASTANMILNIPDKCKTCGEPFDKKNKMMVLSWFVEVYNEQKRVDLYALSQRSISNRNFFIPETFLEEKYWNNPYLKHRDGKIWFLPEIQKLTTHTKT